MEGWQWILRQRLPALVKWAEPEAEGKPGAGKPLPEGSNVGAWKGLGISSWPTYLKELGLGGQGPDKQVLATKKQRHYFYPPAYERTGHEETVPGPDGPVNVPVFTPEEIQRRNQADRAEQAEQPNVDAWRMFQQSADGSLAYNTVRRIEEQIPSQGSLGLLERQLAQRYHRDFDDVQDRDEGSPGLHTGRAVPESSWTPPSKPPVAYHDPRSLLQQAGDAVGNHPLPLALALGGGLAAAGLGGYGLYRYLNSRKKKPLAQAEKEAGMPIMINQTLLACARAALAAQQRGEYLVKRSAVPAGGGGDPSMGGGAPPGMDPSMGGGAPPGMDPSMMGGAPPPGGGGMPPGMDPSMGGGAPPGMDPSMMGGAPPPPGGDLLSQMQPMIEAAIQKAMGAAGGAGAAGAAAGGAAGAAGAGAAMKVKPEQIYTEVVRLRKMVITLMNHFSISLPPDILNDPSMTNDAAVMGMPPGGGNQSVDGSQPAPPPPGGDPGAVPPIEPVQPAFGPEGAGAPPGAPPAPGGDPKQGAYAKRASHGAQLGERARALKSLMGEQIRQAGRR